MSVPPDNTAPRSTSRRALVAAVPGVLLIAGLAVLTFRQSPEPVAEPDPAPVSRFARPEPPPQDYAGSAACAECHADTCELYAAHPMARSSRSNVVGVSAPAEFAHAGKTYKVSVTNQRVVHHEAAADALGELYDQAEEIQFAIGSGQRGHSFVLNRNGKLFQSPIAWYAQRNRWDLSPGYHSGNHARFERPIIDRCLSCHLSRTAPDAGSDQASRLPGVEGFEHGISCERCHGPAGAHLQFRRTDAAERRGVDPILRLATLDGSRRDALCNQCHLSGVFEVTRYGRSDFDFRPGMRLGEVWTIFVRDPADPRGSDIAISQVEHMHASRCWQESGGRLSCLSCHDPHTLFPEEQKAVAFRRQCLECHSDRGCALPDPQRGQTLPADNCIECHMPRLAAADVPHTTQTDHRILRIRPRPRDAVQQSGTETDSEPLIFGEGVDVPRWELDRARGIRLARWAESSGNRNPAFEAEHLLSPLADRLPDDADLLDALAMAYVLQGRKADASECWRQILEHDPEYPQALLALATLSQQRGDWEASLKFWDRLLAVNAWSAEGHAQRARVLQELGRSTEAVTAARQSLAVDPSDPVMTDWLAGRLQAAEQKANAERLRKQALRLKNLQQRKLRPAR